MGLTVDPAVLPGLLLLLAELAALAAVGYVVVRVALRQDDERMALAQGLVVGPALWGLIVNLVLNVVPGLNGAAVGWAIVVSGGAVLALRFHRRLRSSPRTVAGFLVAVLALFWIALASRQLLSIPDANNHLGLAASIRAGGFPPAFFWTPDFPASYHYGTGLLIGLLTPPFGPDLAFTTEVLDAWMWTSFVLVVVTALLRRSVETRRPAHDSASIVGWRLDLHRRSRRHRPDSCTCGDSGTRASCFAYGDLLAIRRTAMGVRTSGSARHLALRVHVVLCADLRGPGACGANRTAVMADSSHAGGIGRVHRPANYHAGSDRVQLVGWTGSRGARAVLARGRTTAGAGGPVPAWDWCFQHSYSDLAEERLPPRSAAPARPA